MNKKLITLFLALCMICSLLPFAAFAAEAEELEEAPTKCGEQLTWSLEDGILTISGEGKMNEFSSFAYAPWFIKNIQISSVVIEDGATDISANAFGSKYLGCPRLESIVIPKSIVAIGDNAFEKCNNLTDVFYSGSKDDWAKISGGDDAFADNVRIHWAVADPASHVAKKTVNPTCVKEGSITRSCSCGYDYEKETIEMVEHAYDDDGVCAVCGEKRACWHSHLDILTKDETVEPTCTEEGYTIHTCSICHATYKDTYTDLLGHEYGEDGRCIRCGELDPNHVHSYTEKHVKATCTEEGCTLYTCACGSNFKEDVVPALGHDVEIVNAREATNQCVGYTGDKVCKTCGKVIQKGNASAHACTFSDIRNSGYHDWIEKAAEAKIIEGYPDGSYRPNEKVTRAQFITMLYRAVGKPTSDATICFNDNSDIATPYIDAVTWGVENKIILGYADNYFRPNQNISRAQMATFLYRYLKNVVNYNFGEITPVNFVDKDQIDTAYVDAVNAIVSMGIMNGMTATSFEPNETANRGMAATVMIRGYDKLMAKQAAQDANKQPTEELAPKQTEKPVV